jgi:hypothetical protein
MEMKTMRHQYRRPGFLGALILAVAVLAAPALGGSENASVSVHRLHVDLSEWAVIPSQGVVPAGPLRLTVQNFGKLRHELDIVPTERWGKKLPIRGGRAVGEVAAPPIVVAPGEQRSARVNLAPGFYVLLDNLAGHYAAGGAVSIVVIR